MNMQNIEGQESAGSNYNDNHYSDKIILHL
jgi:hypothetical protein